MKLILCLAALFFAYTVAAQTSPADNKPFQAITFRAIPRGPSVFGVFQGRTPCEIARWLGLTTDSYCEKLKWEVVLYRDSVTMQPVRYLLSIVGGGEVVHQYGGTYRWYQVEGRWTVLKNVAPYPSMDIFRLSIGDKELYLLKGDDNVLFILDKDKAVMAGNEDFSYTLNRVELVAGKK
ncbi:MAG TPA: hypothetical protein VI233_00650 [Puia sp.]